MISFVSGKGGTGKTSVCLAAATLLTRLGYKVLAVDFDFATHGMTYFFVQALIETDRGFEEIVASAEPPYDLPTVKHLSEGFDLVPSRTNFDVPRSRVRAGKVTDVLDRLLAKQSAHYDYILVDCQAGYADTVRQCAKRSTSLVVVAEADPVSVWAINTLRHQLRADLPDRTYGLINKLFLEEEEAYEAIADFSRLLRYLPPLPFDRAVRRAFMRRRVPVDVDSLSPFGSALLGALEDLLPDISSKVAETKLLERSQRQIEAERKLAQLEEDYLQATSKLLGLKTEDELRGLRARVVAGLFAVLAAVGIVITFIFAAAEEVGLTTTIMAAAASGLVAAYGAALYLLMYQSRIRARAWRDTERERLERHVNRLRRTMEGYEVLVHKSFQSD